MTDSQKVFTEMFNEGLAFTGHPDYVVDIVFTDNYSFEFIRPEYHSAKLYVSNRLLEEYVAKKQPTMIRSQAYYYAFGFHKFLTTGLTISPFPKESEAIAFLTGLLMLNGIPCGIPPFVTERQILELLSHFTKKQFKIGRAIGADGRENFCLALSDRCNHNLFNRLNSWDKQARQNRLDIRFGTKESPFENIDEAIKYIEFLEKEAVENDPFLNSAYNKDIYRYDLGECSINGQHRIGGLYKIPWASMFSSHINNSFPPNSFIVTQLNPSNDDWEWLSGRNNNSNSFIPLFSLKPNLAGRRFLFRGQNEEYIDPQTLQPTCKPNLYRSTVDINPLPHRIKAYEMACLVVRHPLVQLLGIKGVNIFNEPFRFQLNRLGLAQHYYNKTSYLDLTSDIEVAKFFATCKYDDSTDAYTAFDNEEKLGIIYIYDMRLPFEFKSPTLPQLSTIGKQYVFMRSALQSGFLLNMPKDVNLHELPNVYRIYFKHNRNISEQEIKKTHNGKKYFPDDALSQYWKDMNKAPNSAFSISIKAREMYLKLHPEEYRDIRHLDQALTEEEFQLGINQWPIFPEEILKDYYDNSKTLWSEFCKDIYFIGTEGLFMKKALDGLPLNNAYKWAFVR